MMHEKRARNARPYGYGATIAATFFPQRCRGAHRAPVMEICVKFRIFSFTGENMRERRMDEGRTILFTPEELAELENARKMPITFDEDCPETTPERAIKFKRVNPPRKTADVQ